MSLRKFAASILALLIVNCAFIFGQDINLNLKNTSVGKAVSEVQKHSGYSIVVKSAGLDMTKIISLSLINETVSSALKKIFAGQDISVLVKGNEVFVSKAPAQNIYEAKQENTDERIEISGFVKDENGDPLAGAGVFIKGNPTEGAVTDINGRFSIKALPSDLLAFSFIGYVTKEVQAGKKSELSINLFPDSEFLKETVVIGYGVQKKVNLTGAVAVVDGETLRSRSASNVADLLKGSMPNVNISNSSGRAGIGPNINIRGTTSIASSTGPLVLVDGVEGSILDVNPNDVETVSVLKDASSAAVYGARAGFGVILITTKKGIEDKVKVSYGGKFSLSSSTVSTDFETRGYYSAYIADTFYRTYQGTNYTTYNEEDYHELWIRRNDRYEDPSRPWVIEKNGEYKYYGNFRWYDYLYNNTRPTHEHSISVSGGNKKINFLLSGNYYNQKGVSAISPDRYIHYNFRAKISAKITDWLEVNNNTAFSKRTLLFPGSSSSFNNYYTSGWQHALASIVPIHPDGSLVYYSSVSPAYAVTNGVSAIAQYGKHDMADDTSEIRSKFEMVLRPFDTFDIRVDYSYTDMMFYAFNRFVDIPYSRVPGKILYMSASSDAAKDKIQESFNTTKRNVFNAYATYSEKYGEKHEVKAMLGTNYEYKRYKTNYMRRNNLLSEEISDFNIAVGDDIYTRGGQNAYAILGYFYRLNYSYSDKYLIEASGRYDGSSRFAKGHRFAFFPSFSAGWRISEETFFKPAKKTINNLKLRYSYGSLGNQAAVGYYDYIQTISTSGQLNYAFGDKTKAYYAAESAPNAKNITWETIYTNNAGFDISMLKGRLNVSGDAYIRDTKDMIMQSRSLPSTYGASAPKSNSSNLRTKGYEFTISWNASFMLAGDELSYGCSFGLGDNVSYVTKFHNPNKTLSDPYEGMKLGDIWGYRIEGFFDNDAHARTRKVDQSIVNNMINSEIVDNGLHAGDLIFMDLDGNGKIEQTTSANDIKDQVVIGNSLPRYNYSGAFNLRWKGIDLSVILQGIGRQHWYPSGEALSFWGPYSRPYVSFVPKTFMSQVWSENNKDSYFPRPRGYVALMSNRELGAVNDRYLQNVGYCRLKNLTLGYSLPDKWISKAKIDKIRIYFSGENLLTLSPIKSAYIDPEQASGSLSWKKHSDSALTYPFARTFTLGIDITL